MDVKGLAEMRVFNENYGRGIEDRLHDDAKYAVVHGYGTFLYTN